MTFISTDLFFPNLESGSDSTVNRALPFSKFVRNEEDTIKVVRMNIFIALFGTKEKKQLTTPL
jgi:hypothetical protein